MSEPIPETARERAELLLSSGLAGDRFVRERGVVGQAVAVREPAGGLHSWFVPVTVGKKLAGFLQLLPDLDMMRYSSFQRREGDLESCPEAANWLDGGTIRSTARTASRPEEELGEPLLTFDGSPERIVWAVPAVAPGGELRTILVAGDAAWVQRAGGGGLY